VKIHWWRRLLLGFGFGGVVLVSASIGVLFALSEATAPLLKQPLSVREIETFAQDRFIDRDRLFPELSRPVNILVMGMSVLTSDVPNSPEASQNSGYLAQVNAFNGLSDVMLLLRFDPQTQQLTVLSIPRDTRVVTERGASKINAANASGGPANSAQRVSQLLSNIPVDRYLRVNVMGVQRLIDALGGVTVDIPEDLKYTDKSQHLYIDLKAGRQHLNGEQTLQLLRFRQDSQADIGRIGRQQLVMQALLEQKVNPLLLLRLPQILNVVESHLDSNLQGDELVALGIFLTNTNREEVELFTLPGTATRNGVSYWLPDEYSIQQLVEQYFLPR
jgi:LCP family protein required for cell wall assembly